MGGKTTEAGGSANQGGELDLGCLISNRFLEANQCPQTDMAGHKRRREDTTTKSQGVTRAMVRDLASGHSLSGRYQVLRMQLVFFMLGSSSRCSSRHLLG